jgi:secreted PhoX family phosphatase
MSHPTVDARRRLLKLLSGAPLLPMTSSTAFAGLLAACGGGDDGPAPAAPAATVTSVEFTAMAAPAVANVTAPTAAELAAMGTTTVGSKLVAKYSDGTTQTFALKYEPFFITGEMVPDGKGSTILAGGYVDMAGKPIQDTSKVGMERQFFSDSPDGSSLLTVPNPTVTGLKGKAVFAVVQFEYMTHNQAGGDTYGTLPSPIAVLTLDQDQTTGKLSLVKYHNVDTSPAHGLWITCGASLSPWGTHLSSEEYEPDAAFIDTNTQFKAYSKNTFGDETKANPYHYGHLPEVTVNPDGTGTIKKHFCLGRISHELIQVMPDQRTAIMGDDYTNGGFFMFVADKAKDLSAGTLYVAKVGAGFSIDPAAAGAPLTWVKLGHATSAEVEALANTLKASDIMAVSKTDPADASYTKIFCDGKANWVKLVPGMEKAAAFLETHRYANLVGASMVFTKMEGTTVNAKDKIGYSALQNIQASMVKGDAAWREEMGVSLDKKLVAGGIMAHTLAGGQKDTSGAAIDSEWVPVQTKALLVGEDIGVDGLGNTSHPDKIGNPDNIKFSEKMRTLFIGEDSSTHANNFLWAYNVDTKKLSRLLSVPAGGESTGLHAVDDINGWTYIMSNFQHPGEFVSGMPAALKTGLDPVVKANYKDKFGAAVGYLTGLPELG